MYTGDMFVVSIACLVLGAGCLILALKGVALDFTIPACGGLAFVGFLFLILSQIDRHYSGEVHEVIETGSSQVVVLRVSRDEYVNLTCKNLACPAEKGDWVDITCLPMSGTRDCLLD